MTSEAYKKSGARRMLGVFSHPDDECYGPGGTIARYALAGVDVSILMFTSGEAGSIGISKDLPRDELRRRRKIEFAASCGALGVQKYRMLDVPDKGVASVDREWAVGEIVAEMRRCRPQIVVTFHARGVSGHPDHVAVTAYVDEAFDRADNGGPLCLYEWGIPEDRALLYDRPNLIATPRNEIHAAIAVPDEAMDRKIEAIRCHETQIDFFESLQEKFDYRSYTATEYFTLRRSRIPSTDGIASDLFSGIE